MITFYATCDPPHFGDAGQVFKAMFFGSKNVCFTLPQNAGQLRIEIDEIKPNFDTAHSM